MRGIKSNQTRAVILTLIIILAIAGTFIAVSLSKNNSSFSNGWEHYRGSQYGVEFNYPSRWGMPQMNATSFSKGKRYAIDFFKVTAEPDVHISITMDSNDLIQKNCNDNGCQKVPVVTKSYVQQLKGRFSDPADSTYSVLESSAGNNTLTVYRIKDLPQLNISAIKASYTVKLNHGRCPQKTNNARDCIGKQVYEDLYKLLDSLSVKQATPITL